MFTFTGNKRLRNASIMNPDLLNSHSEGTLVPHIHKCFFANTASVGKCFPHVSTIVEDQNPSSPLASLIIQIFQPLPFLMDSVVFHFEHYQKVLTKQHPNHCGRRAPGFLKLFLCVRLYVCLCVCVCLCVSAPKIINNQWRDVA